MPTQPAADHQSTTSSAVLTSMPAASVVDNYNEDAENYATIHIADEVATYFDENEIFDLDQVFDFSGLEQDAATTTAGHCLFDIPGTICQSIHIGDTTSYDACCCYWY